MTKLLITGGSGYLGSRLLDAAKDQFETFATFFSRPFDGGLPLDVRDADAVKYLCEKIRPDCVIHTAYGKTQGDWQSIITDGSANIARAARRISARLIHISTDVVFSGARGGYREDDVPDPVIAYGQQKYEAERLVMSHTPDAVRVRTSLIYGLEGDDPHSKFVLDGLRNHQPVNLFTDEYRNPVFVADLTNALLELVCGDTVSDSSARLKSVEMPPTTYRGPLHLAGAECVNRYEFGVLIARYHGFDTAGLIATTPQAIGMMRPKDCSLNSDKARGMLRTRLRAVSEVLAR